MLARLLTAALITAIIYLPIWCSKTEFKQEEDKTIIIIKP